MPGQGPIRAGKAFIELGMKSVIDADLKKARARLNKFGKTIGKIGLAIAGIGASAAAALAPAIKAASDLQEVTSKFQVVFGQQSDAMMKWADDYSAAVGRSRRQTRQFLGEAQDLLVPMGFTSDAAADMSKQMAALAVDLASFNNISDEEAFEKLRSGLLGSSETLASFGVVAKEANVKVRLLQAGIDPKVATDAQKAWARWQIVLESTTAAQGDAERTGGTFAGQMKRLKANVEEAATSIGEALLPQATEMVGVVSDAITRFTEWATTSDGLKMAIEGITEAIQVMADVAGPVLEFLVDKFRRVQDFLALVGAAVGTVAAGGSLADVKAEIATARKIRGSRSKREPSAASDAIAKTSSAPESGVSFDQIAIPSAGGPGRSQDVADKQSERVRREEAEARRARVERFKEKVALKGKLTDLQERRADLLGDSAVGQFGGARAGASLGTQGTKIDKLIKLDEEMVEVQKEIAKNTKEPFKLV